MSKAQGNFEKKVEKEVEELATELDVKLPRTSLSLPIKLIALFTLIGGLSIAGSVFADIFNPAQVNYGLYIVRLVAGFSFILVAYGIVKRQRWSIWLYGLIVIVGLFINPVLAILPAAVVVYLYQKRNSFTQSRIDLVSKYILEKLLSLKRPTSK